jgi:hypothetical protein
MLKIGKFKIGGMLTTKLEWRHDHQQGLQLPILIPNRIKKTYATFPCNAMK